MKLREVSKITGLGLKDTAINEYYRLSTMQIEKRKIEKARLTKGKKMFLPLSRNFW